MEILAYIVFTFYLLFSLFGLFPVSGKDGFCPYPIPKVPANGVNVKFCTTDGQCPSNLKCCQIYQSTSKKTFLVCTVPWAKLINPSETEKETDTVTTTEFKTTTKVETSTKMETTTKTETKTDIKTETKTTTQTSIITLPVQTVISTSVIFNTVTYIKPETVTVTATSTQRIREIVYNCTETKK